MEEYLANLKTYLHIGDTSEDELLLLLLNQTYAKIVNKRYPFGATETQKALALTAYSDVLLDVAIYLYNLQGAEGEKSHNENGISRSYNSIDDLLSGIVPVCKYTSNSDTTVTA